MEKKVFNAAEELKYWHPALVLAENDPVYRSIFLANKYTGKDWQEYHSAKKACEVKGENWLDKRSVKHDEMAKKHTENWKKLKAL
jgi:hypothetical protein